MTLGQPLHRPVDAGETPASGQDGASRIKAIGPRAPALRWGPISRIVQGGMCGILACYRRDPGASPEVVDRNRRLVLRVSKILRHRGPDGNAINIINKDGVYMAHERLIVVDITENGRQPFEIQTPEGRVVWVQNGETYNHDDIREKELKGQALSSSSDCAVTGPLFVHNNRDFGPVSERMDGMFALAMYDEKTGDFYASRDEMGKAPMYWGKDETGAVWVASEMKALQAVCSEFYIFPPGHYMRATRDGQVSFTQWFTPRWLVDASYVPQHRADLAKIHDLLVDAVVKRLMTDVPYGMLLSGGLDSSLVAAIVVKHLSESRNSYQMTRLKTFSVGLKGAPDLVAARRVAEFLGTEHFEFHFTVEDGLDALRDLIWHIESYEQVRAAVPMYLLARKIKAMGIKMVLSGEGADEIFGGYLYFHKAPSPDEFHKECVRKTARLHQWDVLRANKAPFAWGVEPRVPYLDRDFMNYAMDVSPLDKVCDMTKKPDGVHPQMEKYILRKAFDRPEDPYLPDEVLWRQKEQFSDGVGYDWVDGLKAYARTVVTDEMWDKRHERFPVDTPRSREYYLLRQLFEEQFPSSHALDTVPKGLSVACSTPEAVEWDPEWRNLHEISGRAIKVHASSSLFTSMDGEMQGHEGGNGASVSKQGEAQAPQRQGAVKATYARTHARPTPQARPLVREPAVGGTRRAAAGVRGVRGRAGAVPMARVGL